MSIGQHLDFDALNALKDIMEGDFVFLVETFLRDSADRVTTLQSLVLTQDADAIRRAAHSFKGSSSNMGALQLANFCAQLEHKGLAADLSGVVDDMRIIEEEFHVVESLLKEYLD